MSSRWNSRMYWEDRNRDRPCTDLPPAVISPSSYQTNLICFLPPGDLQNDLIPDFASSVTSGILVVFFFFSSTAYLLHHAQRSNGGIHRSRRHLWPYTILKGDDLHASQSLPWCNCDLSLLTTCQGWPTQSLDCNDPPLRSFKHSIDSRAAMQSS